jgi:hypothetical protein
MSAAWEAARARLREVGIRGTTEPVDLDWCDPAPCVACGDPAETAYRGRPFHILCTVELGFYLLAVKRGDIVDTLGLAGAGTLPGGQPHDLLGDGGGRRDASDGGTVAGGQLRRREDARDR